MHISDHVLKKRELAAIANIPKTLHIRKGWRAPSQVEVGNYSIAPPSKKLLSTRK